MGRGRYLLCLHHPCLRLNSSIGVPAKRLCWSIRQLVALLGGVRCSKAPEFVSELVSLPFREKRRYDDTSTSEFSRDYRR